MEQLKIAIQMDDILKINLKGDSTFSLANEGKLRNHKIYYYRPDDLSYINGCVMGYVQEISKIDYKSEQYVTLEERVLVDLSSMDVILLRQDPPFDMAYLTTTYLLDLLPDTLIINNPTAVRNYPEKFSILWFKDLIPPTIITRDSQLILDTHKEWEEIIIKPLFGNAGNGVFMLGKNDPNINSVIEIMLSSSRESLIVQKFIKNVVLGDKRIVLVDGEIAGVINRVPAKGQVRSNLAAGGTAQETDLTPRDIEICERIKPFLKKHNLVFTGIDVIDGYLTEINVTSPTGIVKMQELYGINIASNIWQVIEDKILAKKQAIS